VKYVLPVSVIYCHDDVDVLNYQRHGYPERNERNGHAKTTAAIFFKSAFFDLVTLDVNLSKM